MRVVRAVTGVLAGLLGLLGAVAGGVAAFALIGPGDMLTAGTHRLTTDGVAIATAPSLIRHYDARLVVTAEPSRRGQQVFVGVGNHIDVASYLAGSASARVVEFGFPSTMRTSPVSGAANRRVPPGRLGWWVAEESGPGARTLSWRLADGPYDIVVMNADGRPGVDVRVSAAVQFPGANRLAVVVFVAGLVLLVVAAVVLLWDRLPRVRRGGRGQARPRRRRREDDEDLLWEGREAWEENEYWAAGPSAERPVDERPSWLDSSGARDGDGAEPQPPGSADEPAPDREPDDQDLAYQDPADQAPTDPDPSGEHGSDGRRVPAGPPPGSPAPRRTRPGWESSGKGTTSGPVSPALPWRPGGTRRPAQPAPPPTSPGSTSGRPDRLHDGRPSRPDTPRPDPQNENNRDGQRRRDTGDGHELRDTRTTGNSRTTGDSGDSRGTGDGDDQRR
ncbi:hypothetical protein SAMN05421678_11696 [Actinopolymorpha cephalotaxi]|nr:hypothetical protein SAMN05421678_11696 [Actinopolymorpha cephalotaxi]